MHSIDPMHLKSGSSITAVLSRVVPTIADGAFSDDERRMLTAASAAAWLAALRRRAASLSVWHTRVWQARQNHCSPSAVLLQHIHHSPAMPAVSCTSCSGP